MMIALRPGVYSGEEWPFNGSMNPINHTVLSGLGMLGEAGVVIGSGSNTATGPRNLEEFNQAHTAAVAAMNASAQAAQSVADTGNRAIQQLLKNAGQGDWMNWNPCYVEAGVRDNAGVPTSYNIKCSGGSGNLGPNPSVEQMVQASGILARIADYERVRAGQVERFVGSPVAGGRTEWFTPTPAITAQAGERYAAVTNGATGTQLVDVDQVPSTSTKPGWQDWLGGAQDAVNTAADKTGFPAWTLLAAGVVVLVMVMGGGGGGGGGGRR